jgi:hypothetical protein
MPIFVTLIPLSNKLILQIPLSNKICINLLLKNSTILRRHYPLRHYMVNHKGLEGHKGHKDLV